MSLNTNSVKTMAAQLVPTFSMKVRDGHYGWREYKRTQISVSSPTSLDLGHFQALAYRPPAKAYSLFIPRNKMQHPSEQKKSTQKAHSLLL